LVRQDTGREGSFHNDPLPGTAPGELTMAYFFRGSIEIDFFAKISYSITPASG
jgi:hypothetical protein